MKKVIIVLTLCLLTCACVSNKSSKEILERAKYTNTKQIVKENIYGCWNFDSLDVYREKRLIYDAKEHSTINFSKDSLEYCYYNEKSKLLCINLNYEIDGNFLKIEKNDTSATLFAKLADNTINDINFYFDKSIEETIEYLESGIEVIGFRIFWVLLMGGCVFGFCYLDNKWLEDK